MSDLRREFGRKAFHMLSLVYWGAFFFFGWPRIVYWMAGWLASVLIVETARLRVPAVERALVGLFEGLIRETERKHYSGIVHTTTGSLCAMLIAQGDPVIVGAAIGALAFGDAAAALVGKAFGRTKIFGGQKSLEGSLACFAAAFAVAIGVGVRPGAALAAALAASAVELLPTTGFFNDNLWMPVAAAVVLRVLGAEIGQRIEAMALALASSRRVEGLSGAVRLILEEARAAAGAGWQVDVYSEKIDASAVRSVGANPHRVPRWPWGSWLKRRAFAALAGRAARGHDVVHGHGDLLEQDVLSLHNCVHAAHEAATGKPLPAEDAVGRMHALQLTQRRFRLLAANSRLMKDDVTRRFGVPAETIEVVYPGFDPRRFHSGDRAKYGEALRWDLGLTVDQPLFGLITSGDFEKRGLTPFLRAFATVSREVPTARALIVGKETRPGPYHKLAAELRITDKVFFREPISEVERLYHGIDIYVHAAKWEEFGMTVLEALACGVPTITGAKVGASELLSGQSREFVLPDLSHEALTAAMTRLGRDPVLRARLSSSAPAAAAPFTLAAHGRSVLSLYERLLKK